MTQPPERPRSRYIVGRRYDWAFFLAPPLLALVAGFGISRTDVAYLPIAIGEGETTLVGFAIGALIHAHLVAVFFRSHGNRSIFGRHPVRFLVVPPLVFLAIVVSPWLATASLVIATFWDVWHSGAQTFGLGRIYDRNVGAPPEQGRRLDFWLNQLLYAGPILAGATLMDHVVSLEEFETFDDSLSMFLTWAPVEVEDHRLYLVYAVLGGGALFLGYYLFAYRRLASAGYRISRLKVFLYVSTGACSIVAWGFNSWGEAFFIMNLFHAVQYLALVWATEHRGLMQRAGMEPRGRGRPVVLVAYLTAVLLYGCAVELFADDSTAFWALTMVVSLMHFWYDAFIWSVRARQV